MLGDRRLPFAVEFDQPCIKPQLRSAEANQFLEELEWLLLRETVKEPDKGDLVGNGGDLTPLDHVSPVERDNVLLYGQFILDQTLARRRNKKGRADKDEPPNPELMVSRCPDQALLLEALGALNAKIPEDL
jgi:hypothetical protein